MPLDIYNHNLTCIIHFIILLSWYLTVFLPFPLVYKDCIAVMRKRDESFIQLLAKVNYNLNILNNGKKFSKTDTVDTNYMVCLLIQDQNGQDQREIKYSDILRRTRYLYRNTKGIQDTSQDELEFDDDWEFIQEF